MPVDHKAVATAEATKSWLFIDFPVLSVVFSV
jgi:hypothetical protein